MAPGQFQGYSVQEVLAAHRLLKAPPGAVVSIEVLDDVSETNVDGGVLVQSKSALVTNPIADRAPAFWKTFYNWLGLLDRGDIRLSDTTFVLHVSKPLRGDVAVAFKEASDITQAAEAVATAKAKLWGPAPSHDKRELLSPKLAEYVNPVLAHEKLPELISRFDLEFGSGSAVQDFIGAFVGQLALQTPEHRHEAATHALGWVKREASLLLEQGKAATLSRDAFHRDVSTFLAKLLFRNMLRSFARQPTASQKEAELLKLYVRQLQIIELAEDDVLSAVTDFLMAASDRAEWAKRGLVHESSFDEFAATLESAWKNLRIGAHAKYGADANRLGQSLYAECMQYRTLLEGMSIPEPFTRGCFHSLSDVLRIGWHPDYKKLVRAR